MPSALKAPRIFKKTPSGTSVTSPQSTTPIKVLTGLAATTVVTLTFDQAVSLKGVPKYTTDIVAATAISAVLSSPNTLVVTFSASVATATVLNIPYEDPAVRNASGGFVSTSTFPV